MSPPAKDVVLPAPPEFGALYRATLSPLRRYLASLLGHDARDAQDIAHDAYLRAYSAMQAHPVDNPQALLFTAARNLAFTYRSRRASRMVPTETSKLEDSANPSPAPSEAFTEQELITILHEAILALPPGCRQVLVLRHLHGLSYQQVADRLGISLSGVEKQLHRSLRLLREEMNRRTE